MTRRLFLLFVLALIFGPELKAQTAGPRDGKYRIFSYGAVGKPPLFLGSFTLSGGKYQVFLPGDRMTGEGTYSFDAAGSKVVWLTGPYVGIWSGDFTSEREGKTHKIRMKSTTIATNSLE